MTSLFAQIQNELETAGVSTTITNQIGTLTDARGLLTNLATNPPSELGEMVTSLQGLSLPQIEPLDDLSAEVKRLGELVPANAGELTRPLEDGLGVIVETVQADLLDPLTEAIATIEAVYALLRGSSSSENSQAIRFLASNRTLTLQATPNLSVSSANVPPQFGQALDELPSPLTVESFLRWLSKLLEELPTQWIPAAQVPVITEFQQALETILSWLDFDGTQLATTYQATLQSLAQFIEQAISTPVQQRVSQLETLAALVPLESLRSPMQAIDGGLQDLARAVESGDLSGVSQRITTLNTSINQVKTTLTSLNRDVLDGQSSTLVATLSDLPNTLDNQMRQVLVVLQPSNESGMVNSLASIDRIWNPIQADELVARIEQVTDWLLSLIEGINLEGLREPMQAVINGAKSTVGSLDNYLIELTAKVSLLFDEVDTFVDKLNVEAVTQAIEKALTDLRDFISKQIDALFEPVKAVLSSAIGTLRTAVNAFSVEAVIDALRKLIQGLTGLLDKPEVANVFETAQKALDKAVQALAELSFRPVTDATIAAIEEVTAALKQIDASVLPEPAKAALQEALAALPDNFQPIIDEITSKFEQLIEQGPKPLLTTLEGKPKQLAETIQNLSPEKLIGDRLSAPYQSLIQELSGFQPSQLLSPVQAALDTVKERLQDLNPAPLLAPLTQLHQELLANFSKLNPGDIVQPLLNQVQAAIDKILEHVPAAEILEPIEAIVEAIQNALSNANPLLTPLQKLSTLLEGLSSPEEQVRNLVDRLLGIVDRIPDLTILQPAFATLRNAIAAIQGLQLQSIVVTPLSALINRLNSLEPTALLTAVVRRKRDFPRAKVEALPPSPEREQLLNLLNEFKPLDPAFAGPFSTLQTWRTQLEATRSQLLEFFPRWDTLYHQEQGPFAEFRRDGITKEQLRGILQQTLESGLAQPLILIFQGAERLQGVLSQVTTTLTGFVEAVQAQMSELLLIPEALQAIQTAMNEFVATLQNFNLSFLTDEVQDVFNRVKQKLEALNPAQIQAAVADTFNDLLNSLQVDALLPTADIAQLDGDYQQILDKLGDLDPKNLVVEVLQPEFESGIQPILAIFAKLSEVVQALIDRLDDLDAELNQELARTGDAFNTMVQAIPV